LRTKKLRRRKRWNRRPPSFLFVFQFEDSRTENSGSTRSGLAVNDWSKYMRLWRKHKIRRRTDCTNMQYKGSINDHKGEKRKLQLIHSNRENKKCQSDGMRCVLALRCGSYIFAHDFKGVTKIDLWHWYSSLLLWSWVE
jgi:hypothetical protein